MLAKSIAADVRYRVVSGMSTCVVTATGSGRTASGPIAVRLLLAKAAGQQRAPISAVPLLPWVIHKRTAIEILHNAMVPEASDDLAFTDLVRLAGP